MQERKKIEVQWELVDANSRTALKRGSGTLMREKNQRKMFFRDREGEGGRVGGGARDEGRGGATAEYSPACGQL